MKTLDFRGKPCPEPVVESRKAMEEGHESFIVLVDNPASVKNVTRAAKSLGWKAEVAEEKDFSRLVLSPGAEPRHAEDEAAQVSGKVIFLATDRIGTGDDKLGRILTGAFLKTLAETDIGGGTLILMNAGVKLAVEGSELVETLQRLQEGGWELRVCGTCLDYLGLKEKVRAGEVTNMFDIVERLLGAGAVIRP